MIYERKWEKKGKEKMSTKNLPVLTYLDAKIFIKSAIIGELRAIEERLIASQIDELTATLQEEFRLEELRLAEELSQLTAEGSTVSTQDLELKEQENVSYLEELKLNHLKQIKDLTDTLNAELLRKLRKFTSTPLVQLLSLYDAFANREAVELRIQEFEIEAAQMDNI